VELKSHWTPDLQLIQPRIFKGFSLPVSEINIMKDFIKTTDLVLLSIIKDGMNNNDEILVTQIRTWINRNIDHGVNEDSIKSLLKDAANSNMMTIDSGGQIDAFGATPHYSNGQNSVYSLHLNGVEIWRSNSRSTFKSSGHLAKLIN